MPSPFSALSLLLLLLLLLFASLVALVVAVLAVREREVRSLPLCIEMKKGKNKEYTY